MAKKKKMLAAALAASMVMGLTACGGSSQPTETKAPESAKETEAAAEGTTDRRSATIRLSPIVPGDHCAKNSS